MSKAMEAHSQVGDAALVERCLRRDDGAWEELLGRYRRRVFNIAYKFVGRFEEAEDLTQEIFFKIYRSLDRFDPAGNFQQWLIRISKNHSIDHYRRRRKDRERLLEGSLHLELAQSTTRSPLRSLELSERARIFRAALERLPPILRTALTLRELEGLSYQEIADGLGIPEGTVKSRINRGRREMARLLERVRGGAELRRAG